MGNLEKENLGFVWFYRRGLHYPAVKDSIGFSEANSSIPYPYWPTRIQRLIDERVKSTRSSKSEFLMHPILSHFHNRNSWKLESLGKWNGMNIWVKGDVKCPLQTVGWHIYWDQCDICGWTNIAIMGIEQMIYRPLFVVMLLVKNAS